MSDTAWPTLRSIAKAARDQVRDAHQKAVFGRAMRMFLRDPTAAADDFGVLSSLVYGWGNKAWSGAPEYLHSCIRHVLFAKAPVLECGSGLTTILIGAVAQRMGTRFW